jgi:hypothetical protein
VIEVAILDESVVDKEILFSACFFGVFGFAYIAFDADIGGIFFAGSELFSVSFSNRSTMRLPNFSGVMNRFLGCFGPKRI